MLLKVRCDGSSKTSFWNDVQSKLQAKRRRMEMNRMRVQKQLSDDVTRIIHKEVEFTKVLVSELVPVRITINKEWFEKSSRNFPIHIKFDGTETKEDDANDTDDAVAKNDA